MTALVRRPALHGHADLTQSVRYVAPQNSPQTVLRLTDSDHNFVLFLRINIEESAVTISPLTTLRPWTATEYNGNIFFNPVTFLLSRLNWIGRVIEWLVKDK